MAKNEEKPQAKAPAVTVGRSVHFQSQEDKPPYHATVSIVNKDGTVGLAILSPTHGWSFKAGVPFAEEPTPGHWNWPPRV